MSRGTGAKVHQRLGASASFPEVVAPRRAPRAAPSRPAGLPAVRPTGASNNLSIIALACLGLLAGPLAISALLGLPMLIIALGIWQDDLVVQLIGGIIFVLHTIAAWSLMRADQTGHDDDAALAVSRHDAADLHNLVNSLRQRVGAPGLDVIRLDTNLNASVSQTPILFGLAGHRHDLTIGLPLLQALDTDEFAAVIAHELAHLRRDDGKLHALVFRVCEQWDRLDRAAQNGEFLGRNLVRRFARWYRPKFEHRSAGVLREGEFAADEVAVALAGPKTTARALTRAAIAQARLIDLWSGYWLQNVRIAKPVRGPWASFAVSLSHAASWRDAPEILRRTLQPVSDGMYPDTHPLLRVRLARLGIAVTGSLPVPPAVVAPASRLLGSFHDTVIDHFDQLWWRANRGRWNEFYCGVAEQRTRLATLDAAAGRHDLGFETAIERASRAEYLIGPEAAATRFEWCLRCFPTQAAGYYLLGELLLSEHDERGVAHLIHAMSLDETATPDATALITDYLNGTGQAQRANAYIAKANAWMNGDRPAHGIAIGTLAEQGRLTSWPLSRDALDAVQTALGNFDTIRSAWLVQTPLRPWSEEARDYLVIEPVHAKQIAWQLHQTRHAIARTGHVSVTHILGLTEFSADAQNAIRNLEKIPVLAPDGAGITAKQLRTSGRS